MFRSEDIPINLFNGNCLNFLFSVRNVNHDLDYIQTSVNLKN